MSKTVTLSLLEEEHTLLASRLEALPESLVGDEAMALWTSLGVADAARVPDLDVRAMHALRPTRSTEGAKP